MRAPRGAVPSRPGREGRAFAPNHVSGLFVPRLEARDPRARGSLGAGLVLSAGTTALAEWSPAPVPSVRLSSDTGACLEISETVARRLLARRPGRLTVRLEHALPIGQGFGASASGALATGLAVASALGIPRARAVETAHLADLFGGGGLGGVAAIEGGGLELRVRPGIRPYGRVVRFPVDGPVLVGTVGRPMRTSELLWDPKLMRRFLAGEALFDWLASKPGWERFWASAERFTDSSALASPRLRALLRGLRRRGARAAQAMFGASFFAAPPAGSAGEELRRWLTRERVPFRELRVARRGAHTLAPGSGRSGRR